MINNQTVNALRFLSADAVEKATIEMFRRKVEFDGMQAAGEAFRNSVKSFKDRAFAGPGKIPQIPQLIERGKARTEVFFDFKDQILFGEEKVVGIQNNSRISSEGIKIINKENRIIFTGKSKLLLKK